MFGCFCVFFSKFVSCASNWWPCTERMQFHILFFFSGRAQWSRDGLVESCMCRRRGHPPPTIPTSWPPPPQADPPTGFPLAWHYIVTWWYHVMDGRGARLLCWRSVLVCARTFNDIKDIQACNEYQCKCTRVDKKSKGTSPDECLRLYQCTMSIDTPQPKLTCRLKQTAKVHATWTKVSQLLFRCSKEFLRPIYLPEIQ